MSFCKPVAAEKNAVPYRGGLAVFSADERDVMERMNISEAAWLKHNRVTCLSATEVDVMRALGLTPEDWRAASENLVTLSAGVDREALCRLFKLSKDASDEEINKFIELLGVQASTSEEALKHAS